jgi:LAO/AO transport system kinase
MRPASGSWVPLARTCSALTGAGIPELWSEIERFGRDVGPEAIAKRRAEQAVRHLSAEIEDELKARLAAAGLAERLAQFETDVAKGRLTPRAAARALVAELTGPVSQPSRKP